MLQSCPTLCDPVDCCLLGFSVHGILQARILEWVAMPFSRECSRPGDRTAFSHSPALQVDSLPLGHQGWRRQCQPTLVLCLETPVGGGAWWAAVHAVTTSQTQLSDFTFTSLSCTGEGSGNPLQCSCLEKPRDRTEWGRTESDTTEAT